jgi:aldose 1-epimerase
MMTHHHARLFAATLLILSLVACGGPQPTPEPPSARAFETSEFGAVDEQAATLYTLTNASGAKVAITNYGGIVVSLTVPDRDGVLGDVVLGFDDVEPYSMGAPYFGALIGRYGNRIAKGAFTLNGESYSLPKNNGPNSLHGGEKGFDKVHWNATPATSGDGLVLEYESADGEEGYPGTLSSRVTYTWTDDNDLKIAYHATTDKPTVVNLTNHSYFNLKDAGAGTALNHQITINADRYTPIDDTLIPTGEIASVEGTPFDFRQATTVGARIEEENEQLNFGLGYDHNYVLNREGDGLELAVTVYEPDSGRVMEVLTEEPGVQFYSGNFLDGSNIGKSGNAYQQRNAICLETQHFPDSPNRPEFPTTTLNPGETYSTTTVYRFSSR